MDLLICKSASLFESVAVLDFVIDGWNKMHYDQRSNPVDVLLSNEMGTRVCSFDGNRNGSTLLGDDYDYQ